MTLAGVVLAAGFSRRMGTNKALLKCGSETFLDGLGEALSSGGCHPVVAVVGEPLEIYQKSCRLDRVGLIRNPDPSRGQISSLRCALGQVGNAAGIVVLLVDQGRIQTETAAAVGLALERAPVAVARYCGRPGHPTGFRREVFSELESSAADQGARAVIAAQEGACQVAWVDVDDPGVVRNINTPEEYQEFLRAEGLSPR